MAWFHNRTAAKETSPKAASRTGDPVRAEQLLHRAQEVRAKGDLVAAQTLAKEALEQGQRAHGERHPALVPFLLVYAGLLNQCQGWAAGKPFYEKAQRLRGLASAR
jgi:hypothetical protein